MMQKDKGFIELNDKNLTRLPLAPFCKQKAFSSLNIMSDSHNKKENSANDIEIFSSPQNMNAIHEEFGKLQKAISSLGGKMSSVLQSQENEFLAAYTSHMRNVARDFHKSMDEIQTKEKAIENHVLVKNYEKERDWYRNEAFQLDSTLTKTKAKEVELAGKCNELEKDREWLSNQLKQVMTEKNAILQQLSKD